MALIDKIQQNLATAGSTPIGTTDQTGRARTLLAAKSGKALPTTASAPQSAVAESAANDQTNQALAPVQQAGNIAAANVGQQVKQLGAAETGARADLALRQQQLQQSNSIRKQQLLGDLGRDRASLDLDKDRAKLEQLAFTMRLSDKKYVDQLEAEGYRKRLDSDLGFKEELQKSIFGSNTDLVKKGLGNKDVLSADNREFAQALANIDINAALQVASNEAADAKQAAMISGVGGLATAGVGYYGSTKNASTTGSTAAPGTSTASSAPASDWDADNAAADAAYGD